MMEESFLFDDLFIPQHEGAQRFCQEISDS